MAHTHANHDHHHRDHETLNRDDLLADAEKRCTDAGESLTPLRRRVLEALIDHKGPAKAYDLMSLIAPGEAPAKPPTIYRTLDFLQRLGLAHRIESVNAFVACGVGACSRSTMFLICENCGSAKEFDAGHALVDLSEAAAQGGFRIKRTMIEATGLCESCASAS